MYQNIIFVNNQNVIIDVDSIPLEQELPEGAIKISESEENIFLPAENEPNWGRWINNDSYLVPLFQYDPSTQQIVKRPQEDIDYDIEHAPPAPIPEPSQLDRLESQIVYTAMMTDTLLEEE